MHSCCILWRDVLVGQNKMQTDQDEQQNQGDSPKEPEEKPRENEEMEVKRSFFVQYWHYE